MNELFRFEVKTVKTSKLISRGVFMMVFFFGKWNCDGGKRSVGKGKVLGMQKGRRRQERGVQLLRFCFEVKKKLHMTT